MVTVVALVLFAVVMTAVGIYSTKHTKTMDGFLLGGRNIGAWVSAFAYGTSYFSAVIFIGYAGKIGWDVGFASMWIGIGNAVFGCLLSWFILAKKTRRMTHKLNVKTMPELFEARFGSKNMKIYSAIIVFIFLVPYSAAVYKGLGSMFSTIFTGVEPWVCMLIVAILTSIYLVLGGYVAAAYTDFIQGIIMIVGVVAMVVAIINNPEVGGLANGIAKIKSIDPQLTSIFGGKNWSFLCINILLTSFGTWGLPHMVNKFYAIKDEKSIAKATVISTAFALIIGGGAYFVGSLSRIFLNELPKGGYDAVVPQTLMLTLGTQNLFTIIILAVILLLLLSASMSTLSAIVLTSASAISVDLIPAFKKNVNLKRQMIITRLLCFLFVAFSYIFATMNIAIIVSIMSFSWGIVSGCFIGPFIWGLYSKRTTAAGAWCGLIGGFVTVVALTIYQSSLGGFASAMKMSPQFGVTAMAVSFIIVPLVSAFTKKPSKEIIESAF